MNDAVGIQFKYTNCCPQLYHIPNHHFSRYFIAQIKINFYLSVLNFCWAVYNKMQFCKKNHHIPRYAHIDNVQLQNLVSYTHRPRWSTLTKLSIFGYRVCQRKRWKDIDMIKVTATHANLLKIISIRTFQLLGVLNCVHLPGFLNAINCPLDFDCLTCPGKNRLEGLFVPWLLSRRLLWSCCWSEWLLLCR